MIKRLFIIFLLLSLCALNIACKGKNDSNGIPKDAGASKENNTGEIPKITASVDRSKVHVGDLIDLSLKYSIPEGSSFAPETDLTGIEGLTIIGKKVQKNEIIFNIIVDKPESFNIGPVSLSFKNKSGDLNIIRADALHIEVLSNLGGKPAEARLKPIADIIPTYPLWLKILPWALGILLLFFAGAGIYYWRKRKHKEAEALMNIKPPHELAKEEIEKLISMNLIDKGGYKEFYFRFSEILRQYLESLRGFPAAELTTEEISRRIRNERDRKLLPVLREADLVKFADSVPTKAKNEQDIAVALDYIRETTPVSVVAEHAEHAS